MSQAEFFCLVASIVTACWCWIRLGRQLLSVKRAIRRPGGPQTLFFCLLAVTSVNWIVLSGMSSGSVRSDGRFLFLYLMLGYALSGLGTVALRIVGLQVSDIAERGNRAVAILFGGMFLASALAGAGASVGEGPGFEVVLFCSALSLGLLWASLFALAIGSRGIYRVLTEQDRPRAFRMAAALVAIGLIAGRSVAGTWVSAPATLLDFAQFGWPGAFVPVMDIAICRWTPTADTRGLPAFDAAMGLLYLISSGAYVAWLGVPQ